MNNNIIYRRNCHNKGSKSKKNNQDSTKTIQLQGPEALQPDRQRQQSFRTMNMVLTGLFIALLCIFSQVSIPSQPIPFTLSLFGVFLTGAVLSPRSSLLAALSYILLGIFGLPVFAGMRGGLQVLAGPTGGFLAAYPGMVLLISLSYKYTKRYKIPCMLLGMAASLLFCYLLGTIWFMFIMDSDLYSALTFCVLPFIPFDIIKIILAAGIAAIYRKAALRLQ